MMNGDAKSGAAKPLPVAFEDSSNESQAQDVPVPAIEIAHQTNGNKPAPPLVMAVEDSSDESQKNQANKKAESEDIRGSGATVKASNTSSPRASVVAVEDSSPDTSSKKGENGKPTVKSQESGSGARTEEVSPRPSPRTSIVVVEEDEAKEARDKITPLISSIEDGSIRKSVCFENVNRKTNLSKSDVFVPDDEIPVPYTRCSLQGDQLDLSLTEHHRKGGGILASQRELSMDPQEFAIGCNLLQAAARGDRDFMEKILKKYPRHVNFRDYDRRTALHVASSEGHLDICKFLVEEKGCRINRSDRWGGSPLDDAHRHRQEDVVKFLREKGATTGSLDQTTNLITAAAEGDEEEVGLLLNMCRNKDIDSGDYDKRTALHLAAGEGRLEIVRLLCEAGADVNVKDRWGGRPLDDAKRNRHDDVVEYLESLGGKTGDPHETEDGDATKNLEEEDDNMRVEFSELEMIERIGAGAFGEIYKCRWRGTLVAAKCVKSARIRREWIINHTMESVKNQKGNVDDAIELIDNLDEAELTQSQKDEAIADFRQEIRVLRNLRHPHIVLLLAYSTTKNYEVMISELMKCSLLDVFKAHMVQGTKMSRKLQILYADQLAQGMVYLHTCKPPVIHRDLKPANLLIDHSGVLKISDFGLAKVRPDPKVMESSRFVMTGETGSYRFMAPEVYRHEDYTETVDVYSYGMILYYLLSGRPPWASMNGLMAVERAAKEGDRPNIPRDWDERLSNLLQRCWDENPQARPSFQKILEVLNSYSRDVFKTDANSVRLNTANTGATDSKCCVMM